MSQPKRARDIAQDLGISEAEYVNTRLARPAIRLDADWASLLHGLTSVGTCMALTRNESCVIEVTGTYGGIELGSHAGQVIGDRIDLRVFLGAWRSAWALDEAIQGDEARRRRSIQVFDSLGTAVHKVYLQDDGNLDAWHQLVAARAAQAPAELTVDPPTGPRPERPDGEVDLPAFHAAWDAMQDTHEFFPLLMAHKVGRVQALRLAGPTRARLVANTALDTVASDAATTGEKIMFFVGNRGCIGIYSGPIQRIVRMGPWWNVLDPGFNLHLREDRIATSWVVRKPTRTGVVSSLELYDAAGETIALVFRKRDDREHAEDPQWSGRLESLETRA
jgi:putative hemin transport protein